MNERKPIGKKVRFEVFKRDNFTCQYCGSKAPDVILHVDHIKPVAEGGENEILNLITACQSCNFGKGKRELSDSAAIEKQRNQLEELQERREQIEMMYEWQKSLTDLDGLQVELAHELYKELVEGYSLAEAGLVKLKKFINQFSFQEVLEAMRISAAQYLVLDNKTGNHTSESADTFLNKIPGICNVRKNGLSTSAYYIRGILRKRMSYVNDWTSIELTRKAEALGIDQDIIKTYACTCSNWTEWRSKMEELIEITEVVNGK